jgi:hypothetical protein
VQRVQRALLTPAQESQLPLEVTALYVATPLTLTLDCDAAVFAITTAAARRSAVAMLAAGTHGGTGARATDGA